MQTGRQTKFLTAATALLLLLNMLQHIAAQRPSFAGLRPPGGLNQLDKYHNTQQNSISGTSQDAGIANRFGGAQQEPVTIAYGAAQRPPTGVVLVHPETQYVPLNRVPAVQPQFSVDNRFGETPTPTPTQTTQTAQNANGSSGQTTNSNTNTNNTNSNANSAPAVSRPSTLPYDAHGDSDLIDQLSRLPLDKQPFWFINYQAIEAHRNSTRPSVGAVETRGSFFGG